MAEIHGESLRGQVQTNVTFLFVMPLQFLDGSHEIRPGTSIEVEHWLPNTGSRRGRWGGRSWRMD